MVPITDLSSHIHSVFGMGTSVDSRAWMTLYSRSTLWADLERSSPGGCFRRTALWPRESISWYVGFDCPKPNWEGCQQDLWSVERTRDAPTCFSCSGGFSCGTCSWIYRSNESRLIFCRTSPAILLCATHWVPVSRVQDDYSIGQFAQIKSSRPHALLFKSM